uniref:ORF61 n=1 Tax=Malaco herpesvirus 1 TaxID=3031797 RepID=A0AA48P843_9VIRU|nr:TPA_asm: ORF61 [Malaco herpesvirus 1]
MNPILEDKSLIHKNQNPIHYLYIYRAPRHNLINPSYPARRRTTTTPTASSSQAYNIMSITEVNEYYLVVFESLPGAGKTTTAENLVPQLRSTLGEDYIVLLNGQEDVETEELVLTESNDDGVSFIQAVYDRKHLVNQLPMILTIGFKFVRDFLDVKQRYPLNPESNKKLVLVYERTIASAAGVFFLVNFFNARMHPDNTNEVKNRVDGDFEIWRPILNELVAQSKCLLAGMKTMLCYFKTHPRRSMDRVENRGRKYETSGYDLHLACVGYDCHAYFMGEPKEACMTSDDVKDFIAKNSVKATDMYDGEKTTIRDYNVDVYFTEDVDQKKKNGVKLTERVANDLVDWLNDNQCWNSFQ